MRATVWNGIGAWKPITSYAGGYSYMSTMLPNKDLSSAVVGTKDFLDLSNAAVSANPVGLDKPYHLLLYNESGCGLQLTFDPGGATDFLPAGAWRVYALMPGSSKVTYIVQYVLTQAGVNTLVGVVYAPSERVDVGVLGNSPVNVGNSVTANVNSINNDGNPDNTQFIEAKVLSGASTVLVFNNGAALFGNVSWDKAGNCTFIPSAIQPTAIKWSAIASGTIPSVAIAAGALNAGVTIDAPDITPGTLDNGVVLQHMVNSLGKAIAQMDSNGGGAAGKTIWTGTTDPGALAAEGDIWLQG